MQSTLALFLVCASLALGSCTYKLDRPGSEGGASDGPSDSQPAEARIDRADDAPRQAEQQIKDRLIDKAPLPADTKAKLDIKSQPESNKPPDLKADTKPSPDTKAGPDTKASFDTKAWPDTTAWPDTNAWPDTKAWPDKCVPEPSCKGPVCGAKDSCGTQCNEPCQAIASGLTEPCPPQLDEFWRCIKCTVGANPGSLVSQVCRDGSWQTGWAISQAKCNGCCWSPSTPGTVIPATILNTYCK